MLKLAITPEITFPTRQLGVVQSLNSPWEIVVEVWVVLSRGEGSVELSGGSAQVGNNRGFDFICVPPNSLQMLALDILSVCKSNKCVKKLRSADAEKDSLCDKYLQSFACKNYFIPQIMYALRSFEVIL